MERIAADWDRWDFLAGNAGHSAFASSGMEGNPADDADLAGIAGTCAAAEYAVAGRRYRLFLVPPSGICYSDSGDYVPVSYTHLDITGLVAVEITDRQF